MSNNAGMKWLEIDCPVCGFDYDHALPADGESLRCPCGHIHTAAELAKAQVYEDGEDGAVVVLADSLEARRYSGNVRTN